MTAAATAVRASLGTATTWTPTPMTSRRLIETLDLKNAHPVGHSAGGGEVARYIGRHGTKRVAKAVLVGAVPPLMLKTPANPGGLPIKAFDRSAPASRRPFAILQGPHEAVLRLQPARRQDLARRARVVLAPGDAGRPPAPY